MRQLARAIISILVIVGFFILAGTEILPVTVTVAIVSGGVSSVITYWFEERSKEKEIERGKR